MGTSLDGKNGTLTVGYNNSTASKDYNFIAEPGNKAATESVTLNNYRQLQVKFNTVVDTVSAVDPSNYYFEIVEGNAGSKLGANKSTLTNALNLAELDTSGWFSIINDSNGNPTTNRTNISAQTVNGKTVVTINLGRC